MIDEPDKTFLKAILWLVLAVATLVCAVSAGYYAWVENDYAHACWSLMLAMWGVWTLQR